MTFVEKTFIFADLSGYTALTEAHGDEQAASIATRFASLTKDALAQGELVKTLGDAVMIAVDDPLEALRAVVRLGALARKEPNFPGVRVGLHHGRAFRADRDYFGVAVNLAARVAAVALTGEVLCTTEVAEVARRSTEWEVRSRGEREFKNVASPVAIFAIALWPVECASAIDPVCRMRVDVAKAITRVGPDGPWYFCSPDCAEAFTHSSRALPPKP